MSSLTRRSPVGFVQTRECRQGPIGRASMATAFVQGQINLLCGAVLSFGLAHYSMSKFELLAEELLMSDSVIRDENVETSSLEASNLIVLNGLSHIHSNANLVVHGQDLFYLSRLDDCMEAQCLVFSFFYVIKKIALLNFSIHLKDYNVNFSLAFTLQICHIEGIHFESCIEGSVVHFHRAKTIDVLVSDVITTSGIGIKAHLILRKLLHRATRLDLCVSLSDHVWLSLQTKSSEQSPKSVLYSHTSENC